MFSFPRRGDQVERSFGSNMCVYRNVNAHRVRLAKRLRGLGNVDDFSLLTLELDIDLWIQQLPEKWPYGLILDVPEANEFMNLLLVSVLVSGDAKRQLTIVYLPTSL